MSRLLRLALGLSLGGGLVGSAGCTSCTGDEVFAAAARGELRAVHELGELGDPVVPPPQTYQLRDVKEAFAALQPHLGHADPYHRLVALEATRRLAQRSRGTFLASYLDLLDPLLGDPDPELRWRAAWALGRLELSRPGLRAATRDADPRVAERALWALGQARDADAVPELIAALERPAPISTRAEQALAQTTGLRLQGAPAWREWWAKRKR